MIEYPSRPQYFAYKLIRQMVKACAAQDIGPLGFALVSTIVTTEDAAGYKRAVTFYDAQLMMILGAENQKKLAAARNKAIAAGWIAYEHGRRGVPGRYFGTIPDAANTVDDAPSDEGEADTGNQTGTRTEPERNKTETQTDRSGIEVGSQTDRSGHPSSLSLSQRPPISPKGGLTPIEEFNQDRRTRDRYKPFVGDRTDLANLKAWVRLHDPEVILRDPATFSQIVATSLRETDELEFYRSVARVVQGYSQ